jgi:hypothetical protein
MDWMFEWQWWHYVAVFAVTALCGYLWYKDRSQWAASRFGITMVLLLLVVGLGMVESGYEQCVRKTQEMSAAISAKNADAFLAHLADDFKFKQGSESKDKQAIADFVKKALAGIGDAKVESLVVDSFWRADDGKTPGLVTVGCFFKPKGPGIPETIFGYARCVFKKDASGQYRMSEAELFKDAKLEKPFEVPGL